MKTTVQSRQLFGFATIIILLICIVGFNIYTLNRIGMANDILRSLIRTIEYSSQMQSVAHEMRNIIDLALLKAKLGEDYNTLVLEFFENRSLLGNYEEKISNLIVKEDKDVWLNVQKNEQIFLTLTDRILALIRNARLEEAEIIEEKDGHKAEGEFIVSLQSFVVYLNEKPYARFSKIDALIKNLQHSLFIIMILSVFLAALSSIIISLSITRPLRRLQKGIEMVGSGNLDYKVGTEDKDEIGQLSRAFDKMVVDLKRKTTSMVNLNNEIIERKNAEQRLEDYSLELALGLSEVFEALKKISAGDPNVRITEESSNELIVQLKHSV
ncbi:MAG: HAMP domain-containing protein, partial [Candidatus Omnitrophota bacterium]